MAKHLKNYRETGDAVILYADNYINDIEGEKLEDLCEVFIRKGIKKIIIDFTSTDLINSIGVSILIGILEKIRDRNGVLLFSGLKKVNHDIFRLVGLTKHIPVYNTDEEAVKELKAMAAGLLM